MIKFFEENWYWLLLIVITIISIIVIIRNLKVKPTTQNRQPGDNRDNTQNQPGTQGGSNQNTSPRPSPPPPPPPSKKFSWWKFGIGLGIIILVLGFLIRINTPYSEKIILKKGSDYTFDVYNEMIVINPQVHCVEVIYPDYTEYTFCPNIPVDAGEHGVGLYRLQATSDSQFVIISKKPLSLWNKFKFWINPSHFKFLFD